MQFNAGWLVSLAMLPVAVLSTNIRVQVPSTQQLPNPATLPASTSATLTTLSNIHTANIGADNTFNFRNVTAGSYLLDIHCPTYAFAPQRVDVHDPDTQVGDAFGKVEVWTSFRGHEWSNTGEKIEVKTVPKGQETIRIFESRVLGPKSYFFDRPKFSPLSLLKNPMILIGGVSMIFIVGMPYLLENMDPEMRAEFEAQQKSSPLGGALTGQQSGANPLQNFDAAAWLAGAKKPEPSQSSRADLAQDRRLR